MRTITASDLKQNSVRLQDALRDDLLVTKRDKPFVVVMDYEKYKLVERYIYKVANDETYRAIDNLENGRNIDTYNSKDEMFDDLEL
jgi:prevent-host-death family protein